MRACHGGQRSSIWIKSLRDWSLPGRQFDECNVMRHYSKLQSDICLHILNHNVHNVLAIWTLATWTVSSWPFSAPQWAGRVNCQKYESKGLYEGKNCGGFFCDFFTRLLVPAVLPFLSLIFVDAPSDINILSIEFEWMSWILTGTTWWRQRIREQRSRRWGSSHSRPRRSLRHRKASPTKHQSITFSSRSACGDQWDADQCLNALSVASACSAVQRHEAVLVRWTRVGSCLSRNILGFGGFYLPHP